MANRNASNNYDNKLSIIVIICTNVQNNMRNFFLVVQHFQCDVLGVSSTIRLQF